MDRCEAGPDFEKNEYVYILIDTHHLLISSCFTQDTFVFMAIKKSADSESGLDPC